MTNGVKVRLNVFSGRPDPQWLLNDRQAAELLDRLGGQRSMTANAPPAILYRLGYRGFQVFLEDGDAPLHIHGAVVGTAGVGPNYVDDDRSIERFLLETMPSAAGPEALVPAAAAETIRALVDADLSRPSTAMSPGTIAPNASCPPCGGQLAPPYNPGMWNVPSVQPYNNCYNYANNIITNTFAQPGRATGKPITALSCPGVQPSAQSDGLTPTGSFAASIPGAYYVALVIWPGADYHWYRQDNGGCWSHKPGRTAATNLDNSGAQITDPRSCDRGPYSDFCTYMITTPGKVKIA